jgi:hypothetical protein
MQFVENNPACMPALFLGKLVRAYVPVPWKWSVGTLSVSLFRWILYGVAFAGMFKTWRQVSQVYRVGFVAMLLTSVTAVVVFWGCARFAFALEPFMIPFAGIWLGGLGLRSQSIERRA